ncbi:Kazal 1 domain containing protein [Asbolus verrucosus]|uniref:Kazal 1 domain containing protein n=1 Tax=Asbolus verrucosus TaxID=1661398 RepID=A0A482VF55_ASBVE|nr:Kazal 1 domain containing protein [Asbolus verrucosus]
MKLLQFCLFVLVYSLLQATASPLTDCWFWEDADPDPGNPPSIRTTTCNPPTSKPPVTTTDKNQEYKNCVQKCPTTPEYNPVCGTNSVTYDNESKLNCARRCGISK